MASSPPSLLPLLLLSLALLPVVLPASASARAGYVPKWKKQGLVAADSRTRLYRVDVGETADFGARSRTRSSVRTGLSSTGRSSLRTVSSPAMTPRRTSQRRRSPTPPPTPPVPPITQPTPPPPTPTIHYTDQEIREILTKSACEAPARQHENSHYTCTEEGELKCLPGWTGDLCDVPICRKGCDPLQGYCKRPGECRCKIGFYGELCDKCIALPGCLHGYCNTSFECNCEEGWDGLFCSEPVCKKDCHATRGYCEYPGECRCRLGWAGETCQSCQKLPGCQHGFCERPLECRCHEGYTGILCQTPICSESCDRDHGYCRKPGECRCKVGWWGADCDECYPYPGCVHGTCRRPWECNCEAGWGGMLCDQELTYCQDNPDVCENGATCVSLTEEDGEYRCLCAEGFTGRNCEVSKQTESPLPVPEGSTPSTYGPPAPVMNATALTSATTPTMATPTTSRPRPFTRPSSTTTSTTTTTITTTTAAAPTQQEQEEDKGTQSTTEAPEAEEEDEEKEQTQEEDVSANVA